MWKKLSILIIPVFFLVSVLIIQPKCGLFTAIFLLMVFASPVVTFLSGLFSLMRKRDTADILIVLFSALLILVSILLYNASIF
ncbi:MAG: hypothetical protein AB9903_04855 [Vulcanimicrobiota bacterium]